MRQEIIKEANYQDGDDCAKKFLCELSGKFSSDLEWDEALLFNVYNQPVLDYSSDSLFFNIAVKVKLRPGYFYLYRGREQNIKKNLCELIQF